MEHYSEQSQEKVKEAMEEMKAGKLKSGRSGKKVTNPKQAIAIGLSEAREEGDQLPPAPKRATKTPARKATKKTATKKAAPKKAAAKKTSRSTAR